jgi:DNA-binding protein HU-beta
VNKSDLVSRVTARLDGDRRAAVAAVNGVLEEIQQSLARGERVTLPGFGTFDRRERGPRTGRNPATGETIQIGATVAPVFRAGAGLRQVVTQAAGTAVGTARTAVAEVASVAQAVVAPAAPNGKPAKAATSAEQAKAGKGKAEKGAAEKGKAEKGKAEKGKAEKGKKKAAAKSGKKK